MKDSEQQKKRDTEAHTENKTNKNAKNKKQTKNEKTYKMIAGCAKGEGQVNKMEVRDIRSVIGFKELRNNISELIDNVITDFNVVISGNVKKNSMKTAAIISTQILGDILNVYKFDPEVNFDNETNQYEVILGEINLYGYGDTVDEAVEMTTDMAIDLAEDYFNKTDVYARIPSERIKYPYFLRIRNCSDREEVKKVLGLVE